MTSYADLIEACEAVHATANGNTEGLTLEQQLEALRLAARQCTDALKGLFGDDHA